MQLSFAFSSDYNVERKANGNFYVDGKKVKQITGKSGGYRFVGVTHDQKIFKADWTENTEGDQFNHQTRDEIEILDRVKPQDRKHFPGVIASGKYHSATAVNRWRCWMIVEKVRVRPGLIVTGLIAAALARLICTYNLTDISSRYEDARTTDSCNWTILGGVPVIYDAGIQNA